MSTGMAETVCGSGNFILIPVWSRKPKHWVLLTLDGISMPLCLTRPPKASCSQSDVQPDFYANISIKNWLNEKDSSSSAKENAVRTLQLQAISGTEKNGTGANKEDKAFSCDKFLLTLKKYIV